MNLKSIFCLLLVLQLNTQLFSQKNALPNIGYEWNKLYENDSKETKDSAQHWVVKFKSSTPEITIKNIIDICGKYYFRLSDSLIMELLVTKLQKFNKDLPTDAAYWVPLIQKTKEASKSVKSASLYSHIWDESINYYDNPYNAAHENNHYCPSPLKDSILSVKFHWGKLMDSVRYREVNFRILQTSNKDRISALFFLLVILDYYNVKDSALKVANQVVDYVHKSRDLTNREKACFIIGCAKIVAHLNEYHYDVETFSWFKQAEGYVSLGLHDSVFLKKTKVITAQYLGSIYSEFSNLKAIEILSKEVFPTPVLSIIDLFKQQCLLSEYYDNIGRYNMFAEGPVLERVHLNFMAHIVSSALLFDKINFNTSSELESYRFKFLYNLRNVYSLRLDKSNEFGSSLVILNETINSKIVSNKFNIMNLVSEIAEARRPLHQFNSINEWDSILGGKHLKEVLERKLPVDFRLYSEHHYKEFDFSFDSDSVSVDDFGVYEFLNLLESMKVDYSKERVIFKVLCNAYSKLSDYEARRGNWKKAYIYSKVADSIVLDDESALFSEMFANGVNGFYLPFKLNLENSIKQLNERQRQLIVKNNGLMQTNIELESSNDSLKLSYQNLSTENRALARDNELKKRERDTLKAEVTELSQILANRNILISVVTIFSVVTIILYTKARRAKRRAESSEAKSTILSHTMHQIGHLAPQCMDEILETHKSKISEEVYLTFEKLSLLLRKFYEYSLKDKITYEQEFYLSCDYIDLAYSTAEFSSPSNKIVSNVDDFSVTPLPTYVMFNAIQNAYKYARKAIVTEGDLTVKLSKNEKDLQMIIVNSVTDPKREKPKAGSGLTYMTKVLNYWNKGESGFLDYGFVDNKFTLTYSFKS